VRIERLVSPLESAQGHLSLLPMHLGPNQVGIRIRETTRIQGPDSQKDTIILS